MCRKCFGIEHEGVQVHIQMANGKKPDKEVMDALQQLIKVARNYNWMKNKLKEVNNDKA